MNKPHRTSAQFVTKTFDEYFEENGKLLMTNLNHELMTVSGLDLSLIPKEVVDYLIRWLYTTQRRRLEAGQPLLITYDILKLCPLWKIIKGSYKTYKLQKDALLKAIHVLPKPITETIKIKKIS